MSEPVSPAVRVARGATYIYLQTLLTNVFGVVYFVFATRFLTVYEVGVLSSLFLVTTILSIDCKHWRKSWVRAAFVNAAKKQVSRSSELAKILPNLKRSFRICSWKRAIVMPIILTLSYRGPIN